MIRSDHILCRGILFYRIGHICHSKFTGLTTYLSGIVHTANTYGRKHWSGRQITFWSTWTPTWQLKKVWWVHESCLHCHVFCWHLLKVSLFTSVYLLLYVAYIQRLSLIKYIRSRDLWYIEYLPLSEVTRMSPICSAWQHIDNSFQYCWSRHAGVR